MASASFKVKPLVLAVSSIISMLPAAQAGQLDTITVSTTQVGGLHLSSDDFASLSLVTITNTGVLNGVSGNGGIGLENFVTIGSVVNEGTVTGTHGIFNYSSINQLTNAGTISGPALAINNIGSIGTLKNTGLISGGVYAINSQGAITNGIENSGVIQGNIFYDSSAGPLNISGGSGSTFGTLTGYLPGSMGSISSNGNPVVFTAGNLLLNDNIYTEGELGYGSVINLASALQVNNTIKIVGSYQQYEDGNLLIGVADGAIATGNTDTDSGYGRLRVSGDAYIEKGSRVSLVKLGSYNFAQGQRYVVIQATGSGTNYNASDLNYSASGYTGVLKGEQVTDSANSALTDLLITLGSAANGSGNNSGSGPDIISTDPISHATTSNARSAFSGLFNYPGTRADLLNLFNASAALGNSAEANRAGAQLSPAGVAGASVKASEAPTNAVLNVISQRSDVIRAAPASGVATGEGDSGIAMWGRGFGGVASLDDSAEASGYDARFGGLLIGADSAVSDQLRLGGVVSYAGTAVDSTGDNSGSKVNIKSYGVFGYANFDAQPWYVDFSTGVVRHQYDSTRHIDFTGFSGDATGSFNGTQYIVSGQTGYPFQLGSSATTLTPIAGLTYSVLHQDGYSEDGGNGAGLTVDGATSTSLKSDLALKLEHSFKTPVGDVVPFAQAGWRHEFHDDALQSLASFSADASGSTSFVSTGAKPVRDTALFSVGTSLVSSDSLSLSVAYTGEAAGNYDSHSGNLLVRWQF